MFNLLFFDQYLFNFGFLYYKHYFLVFILIMPEETDVKEAWGSSQVLNNSFADIMAEQIQEVSFCWKTEKVS